MVSTQVRQSEGTGLNPGLDRLSTLGTGDVPRGSDST